MAALSQDSAIANISQNLRESGSENPHFIQLRCRPQTQFVENIWSQGRRTLVMQDRCEQVGFHLFFWPILHRIHVSHSALYGQVVSGFLVRVRVGTVQEDVPQFMRYVESRSNSIVIVGNMVDKVLISMEWIIKPRPTDFHPLCQQDSWRISPQHFASYGPKNNLDTFARALLNGLSNRGKLQRVPCSQVVEPVDHSTDHCFIWQGEYLTILKCCPE